MDREKAKAPVPASAFETTEQNLPGTARFEYAKQERLRVKHAAHVASLDDLELRRNAKQMAEIDRATGWGDAA